VVVVDSNILDNNIKIYKKRDSISSKQNILMHFQISRAYTLENSLFRSSVLQIWRIKLHFS